MKKILLDSISWVVNLFFLFRIFHYFTYQSKEFREKLLQGGGVPVNIVEIDKLSEVTGKLSEARDELSEAKRQTNKYLAEVDKLDRELSISEVQKKSLHENLEAKIKEHKEEMKTMGEIVKEKIRKKNSKFLKARDKLKMWCEELEAKNLKIQPLFENLETEKINVSKLKQELSDKNDTIEQMEKEKLEEFEKYAGLLTSSIRKKDEEHTIAIRKLHDDHELSIQKLNLDFANAKDDLKAENLVKEKSIKILRGESTKLSNAKNVELCDVKEQLKMRSEELEAEQLKIQTLIKNSKAEEINVSKVKQELSDKIDTIKKMEKDKQEESEKSAKTILDLKIEIENLKDEEHAKKLADWKAINKTLENVLDAKEAQICQLNQRIENLFEKQNTVTLNHLSTSNF